MAQRHELRAYEYVNRPYATVSEALRSDLGGIFGRATQGAASRAGTLAAHLKVELGGLEIGADVAIEVGEIQQTEAGAGHQPPQTKIPLRWKATKSAALFPQMEAELTLYPLSPEETQIDLHGHYTPPLGALGSAVDSLVLHRVADASVHRFVSDLATLLRAELSAG